jgi:hypothetical protein
MHREKRRSALMALVRVLVAIEPNMYWEVLAFHIRQQRPQSVVVLATAQTLQAEAKHTRPHLIIASEVPPEPREMGFFYWVALRSNGSLEADIEANGYSTTIRDVSLEDLVALVDKAEEELAYEE